MTAQALDLYRRALDHDADRARESPEPFDGASELEWQARWFAGEFGCEKLSTDGREIHIEDFGKWNREAGPDFVDARLRIGGKRVRGAVELDIDARDWERHGHGANPHFRDTALHVFLHAPAQRFFTRTCDHREVAQLHLPASGKPSVRPLPARPPLAGSAAQIAAILHAAARHRLDLKAHAWHRHAAVHGADHAWFSALAVALGYKSNKTPLLLLAQRTGLNAVAAPDGEALLFGLAGFLESPLPAAPDRSVRAYLRELWERWWKLRAGCERLILPPSAWKRGGIRPANHPHRRVAALARIAADWPTIRSALDQRDGKALTEALRSLAHPFWNARFNLQAAPLTRPQALVGAERIRDILLNIHHPLAVERDAAAWQIFLAEKGPAPAPALCATAKKFFGPGVDAKRLLSSAAAQQGLLQLERDHRAADSAPDFFEALRRIPADSTGANPSC